MPNREEIYLKAIVFPKRLNPLNSYLESSDYSMV